MLPHPIHLPPELPLHFVVESAYPLIIFKEMGEAKVVLSVIGVFISLSIIGTPLVTYARHLDSIKYAEGSQFVEMINKARNCTNDLSFIDDGLGTHNEHLKYPKHSLVVYKVLTDNKPTIWDTQGDPDLYKPNHEMIYEDYHYNSPSEWLASKKSQVKLIVLVSVGKTEVIGYYQNTGGIPAHKTTYNLSFYDVKTGTIVAKRIIVLFDTDTLNTLDFSNSESWPSNSQVIEQIRNTITFQGD
jgi:hypothetical protein